MILMNGYPLTATAPEVAESVDAILYGLDHLAPFMGRGDADGILSDPIDCPAGVHGYGLDGEQVQAVELKGIITSRRLDADVLAALCCAASRLQATPVHRTGERDVSTGCPSAYWGRGRILERRFSRGEIHRQCDSCRSQHQG